MRFYMETFQQHQSDKNLLIKSSHFSFTKQQTVIELALSLQTKSEGSNTIRWLVLTAAQIGPF